jgi:hypothetical protein
MIINRACRILILLLSINSIYLAQQEKFLLDSLRSKFENFEYSEAINLADNILSIQTNLPEQSLIEIYLIKGISNFSLWNRSAAKDCFTKILIIDPQYIPDRVKISPKVIAFFDEVKLEFINNTKQTDSLASKDANISKSLMEENILLKEKLDLKDATIKSIIFPGWGQQTRNYKLKGWLLTASGLISLSSSVYFIIDSNQKERKYLNETNDVLIQAKYNEYNESYKLRNISISIFTVTWLYNLIDILFISE